MEEIKTEVFVDKLGDKMAKEFMEIFDDTEMETIYKHIKNGYGTAGIIELKKLKEEFRLIAKNEDSKKLNLKVANIFMRFYEKYYKNKDKYFIGTVPVLLVNKFESDINIYFGNLMFLNMDKNLEIESKMENIYINLITIIGIFISIFSLISINFNFISQLSSSYNIKDVILTGIIINCLLLMAIYVLLEITRKMFIKKHYETKSLTSKEKVIYFFY